MMKTLMSGDLNVMSCRSGWTNVHLMNSRDATQFLNFAGRSVEEQYIAVNFNPMSHPFVEVISFCDGGAGGVAVTIKSVIANFYYSPGT